LLYPPACSQKPAADLVGQQSAGPGQFYAFTGHDQEAGGPKQVQGLGIGCGEVNTMALGKVRYRKAFVEPEAKHDLFTQSGTTPEYFVYAAINAPGDRLANIDRQISGIDPSPPRDI
jgi:hypothetical protein